jgi:N-methylhydantoinase B
VISLPPAAVLPLQKGDVVELSVGGGGGYGDPALRAADRIEADLRDGIITEDFAFRHYPARAGAPADALNREADALQS